MQKIAPSIEIPESSSSFWLGNPKILERDWNSKTPKKNDISRKIGVCRVQKQEKNKGLQGLWMIDACGGGERIITILCFRAYFYYKILYFQAGRCALGMRERERWIIKTINEMVNFLPIFFLTNPSS